MSNLTGRERRFMPAVKAAFLAQGLDPTLAYAIAYHESYWHADEMNDMGPDADLGNAWGLFQMTLQTSRGLGFLGDPEALLMPSINAHWASVLMRQNKTALLAKGHAATDEELIAAHNCGVGHVILGTVPASTRVRYVPLVQLALERYRPLPRPGQTPPGTSGNSEKSGLS